jgi:thiamine biosynthesis lipoprotein
VKPSVAAPVVALLAAVLSAPGCAPLREHKLTGRTMGTTYHVTVVAWSPDRDLQQRIDARLDAVENAFSTYRPQSEISRFNRAARAGEPFAVSADFASVMRTAARVFELSGGAWDGTVMPLVDLWGFGPAGPVSEPPPPERVQAALARVGFARIELRAPGALVKREAGVTLDLSSIAKGYGVDAVAGLLQRAGYASFLVEIGGEVSAAGTRRDGQPWRIGVNRPRAEAAPDEVYRVVALHDGALATSGDYRNQFEKDGVRYSHIIDPRTGRPITNRVVSASVLAPDCTLADGLATAVMVMGAEEGISLLERLDGVEGLVVTEGPGGRLEDHATRGFHVE